MRELGITLKILREKKGVTMAQLSQKAGVSLGIIGEIERGRTQSTIKTLNKISLALNLDAQEKEELENAFLGKTKKRENNIIEQLKDPIKMMTVPVYSSVAAGLGFIPDSDPVEYIVIPELSGDCIGAKVSGDSMEPTFYNGDIVILKKEIEVGIGEIGVFQNRTTGEALVKRLKKKNGIYILESDNHIFKDIEIKTDEIVCCGKVVNVVKKDLRKRVDPLYEMIDKLEPNQRTILEMMLKGLVDKK